MPAGPETFERLSRFDTLVARSRPNPSSLPLAPVATLINAVLRPGVDIDAVATTLDDLASRCSVPSFEGLRTHLFDELGFRAIPTGVYDASNSMISDVLATRRGLPVLVAAVMIAVGTRAGIAVDGVGMPYQFLIGDPSRRDVLVDPVTGEVWDTARAKDRFMELGGGPVRWNDGYLRPTPPDVIVERILRNLEVTYRLPVAAADLALVVSMMSRLPRMAHRRAEAKRLGAVFN